MPANVIATDPTTCMATTDAAHSKRPCCNRTTTSAEKVENVVNPPQKPVTSSIRQIGEIVGQVAKKAMHTPIT